MWDTRCRVHNLIVALGWAQLGVAASLLACGTSGAGMGGAPGMDVTGGKGTAGAPGAGGATGGAVASGGSATGGDRAGGGGATANGGTGGASQSGGAGRGGASPSGGSQGGTSGLGGSLSSVTGGAGGAPGGVLGTSDEFEGTSLGASWTVFRGDLVDLAVANGAVSLTPHAKALWYQASQGPLVYKTVTGDFKVTATVHARKASDRTMPPNQFADVGGLMARNPGGNAENYVLGVVGYAEMNQLAVENKSTTNGQSKYGEVAFGADAELRLCRSGATFTIHHRRPGDTTWIDSVAPITRSDLPATLQVGMIAYTGAPSPDYVSIFDRIAFEAVGAGCKQ